MKINQNSLVNFGLRGLTQLARLVITLIVARFLGIAELGLYRMFSIYADYAKQLNGLSFHTFLVRELHKYPREEWSTLFGSTLRFHGVISCLGLVVWTILFFAGLLPWWTAIPFFITVATDIFNTTIENYMIAAGRAVAAGVILFIRQALWVYLLAVTVIWGAINPSLNGILLAWSAGTVLALIAGLVTLYKSNLATTKAVPFDPAWQKQGIKTGFLFTIVGFLLYVVTTVPTILLGILGSTEEVGILSFFFTAFSTVGTLVYASVIALNLPGLLSKHAAGERGDMDNLFQSVAKKSALLTLILTIGSALVVPFLIRIVNQPQLLKQFEVGAYCAIGGILFSLSQLPYLRLYVLGDDKGLIRSVGASAAISVIISAFAIQQFGLLGAALSLIANHGLLCLVLVLRNRTVNRQVAAGSD